MDENQKMTRGEYEAKEGQTLKALPQWQPPQWMARLDERTNKHIAFARQYAAQFAHGAPGHLDLMTIAALAKLLDDRESLYQG